MNGDGIIDDSEAKWYLPASEEMMMAHVYGLEGKHIPGSTTSYWVVNEFARATSFAWFPNSLNAKMFEQHKATEGNVRCARDL